MKIYTKICKSIYKKHTFTPFYGSRLYLLFALKASIRLQTLYRLPPGLDITKYDLLERFITQTER